MRTADLPFPGVDDAAALEGLIARDPALPLRTLLDDDALGSWLTAGSPAAERVRAGYLRYKHGTSATVLLDRELTAGRTEHVVVLATAAAGRPKLAKSLQRSRSRDVVLADLDAGMVAVRPGADRHLPRLRRLLAEPGRVLAPATGPRAVTGLSTLAYKPQRRWVGRADLVDGRSVLVRVYRRGTAARHLGVLAGLQGGPAAVSPLLATLRDDVAVLGWTDGEPLDAVDDLAARPDALRAAGAALARLHATTPPDAARVLRAHEPLGATAAAVADLLPALRGTAVRLAVAVADRLPRTGSPVLVHGDMSADQVVLAEGGPVLLDLDRAGLAPAAADLGSAVAALLLDPVRATAAGPVLDALLAGYRDAGGAAREEDVASWAAASLLGRAVDPFRERRADWPTRVAHALALTQSLLDDGLDALAAPTADDHAAGAA